MKIYTTKKLKEAVKEICDQDILDGKRKRFDWHYLYVLSNIRMRPILDRRIGSDDFVPVNAELLRKLISKQESTSILKNLVSKGILESDNKIIKGVKSRGYKFTAGYSDEKWRLTDISDKRLSLKLDKINTELKSNPNFYGRGYQIASKWVDELEINTRQAKRYISKSTLTDKENESYLMSVEMIEKKQFFKTVDSTAQRFHSNLTNITTPLRQYLSIGGKELWGTDLANSQPVFMAVLMRSIDTVDAEELARFTKCVCDGNFYEYIAEQGGLDLDLTDYKTRKDFKQKVFGGCLFDKNRKEYSKWEKVFAISFPTILKAARKIKEKDYNSFAIMLQKEEAKFIYSTIEKCNDILGDETVLVSIHDSIVSTKESIDMIEQITLDEFQTAYGMTPKLSTTKL